MSPDADRSDTATLNIDAAHSVPQDLKIEVLDRAKDDKTFVVRITCPRLKKLGDVEEDWILPMATGEIVSSLMEEFEQTGREPDDRLLSLRGAGKNLWDRAPDGFKEAYWKLVDEGHPPESILVVSEERNIPWELMMPLRPGLKDPKPLGVLASVARWFDTTGLRSPGSPLADARVVAADHNPPPKPLPMAAEESSLVLQRIGGSEVPNPTPGTLDAMLVPWRGTLLHFICHGENKIPQELLLDGNSTLSSNQVDGMLGLRDAWSTSAPLVFLNACEVGRAAPTLAGTGGFAKSWADAGAGAVIAPLWSVRDTPAHDVAKRFYEAVTAAPTTPFARIVRDIRALAYQPGGEDTYAAYCYFGSPTAAMQMGTAAPAEQPGGGT